MIVRLLRFLAQPNLYKGEGSSAYGHRCTRLWRRPERTS